MTDLHERRNAWEALKARERAQGKFPEPGDPALTTLIGRGILAQAVPGASEYGFFHFFLTPRKIIQ